MHERLEEMNCPLPRGGMTSTEGVDMGADMGADMGLNPDMLALDDQEGGMMAMGAPMMEEEEEEGEEDMEQPDFEFKLSMLPVWAQKAALSRPSVAQQAAAASFSKEFSSGSGGTIPSVGSRVAEGKWAEVREEERGIFNFQQYLSIVERGVLYMEVANL